MTRNTTFYTLGCLFFIGCFAHQPHESSEIPQQHPHKQTSISIENHDEASTSDSSEELSAERYVKCTAQLVEFIQEHRWDYYSKMLSGHGVSPLAKFVITAPEQHKNRPIHILFNGANNSSEKIPNSQSVGKLYTFEIPSDFIKGSFTQIEEIDTKNIKPLVGSTATKTNNL